VFGYHRNRCSRFFGTGVRGGAEFTIDYVESYADRYKKSGNLNGLYIYMARDLKADIAFNEGKMDLAFMVAKENLADAEKGIFIISDPRAREYVNRDIFITYLKKKVIFYQSKL